MKKIVFISLAVIFTTIPAFAQTTIYVNASAGGNNNGSSWTDAYTSLQSALNTASSGDEIWVAKGTYYPSSAYDLTNTSRYYHFRMINGVGIYGGFAGTETAVNQRTNFGVGESNETILSGDIGTPNDSTDNCYHVFYHPSGINTTAILDGFTITKGNGDGSDPFDDAGGMYNSSSSPTINNCTFISNSSINDGGGMKNVSSSSPVVTNSLFVRNTAPYGAGVFFFQSYAVFNNVTIALNNATASGGGGGIRKVGNSGNTSITFNNCIIWGNTSNTSAYQISSGSSGIITLNYSCYANGTGDVSGTITATNNNITSDPLFVDANNGDYRIDGESPAADAGNNSYNSQTYDIRGNGFSRKLSKTDGSAGTIDMGAYEFKFGSDPMPVELTSFTSTILNNKVKLSWQTATEVNNYGFEIQRLEVRSQNTEWNQIGFVNGYGNSNSPKEYSFIDENITAGTYKYRLKQINNDGTFEYSDVVEVSFSTPDNFTLDQNYPNPFNPTTKIRYTIAPPNLPKGEASVGTSFMKFVTLKVYNELGEEVATLVKEIKQPGSYEVEWNASKFASGVYLYKLTSGNFTETKKMLLMK